MAKLAEPDILGIRALIKSGYSDKDIARYSGVVPGTIHHIRYGKTWKHVREAA